MLTCDACNKIYSTPQNLKKHWKRQPMCERWVGMNDNGLKEFVDHKIKVLQEGLDAKAETNTTCMACMTSFANVGNLNRHLATSVVCSKWDLYNGLEPITGFMGKFYSEFDAPAYSLNHIIWNVFLVDKEFAKRDDAKEIMNENNCKYIIAILPEEEGEVPGWLGGLGIECGVMGYDGHNMNVDKDAFDEQCRKIEEYRGRRENVFVFCNNGYQRSIPFLVHYLCHHHADEVPNVERAIDIILPQVDKANYSSLRDKYINNSRLILDII